MIDNDLESNVLDTPNNNNESDKFHLKPVSLPGSQNANIICMSTSKKYIYMVTERSELLCMESGNLKPIQQAYSIRSEDSGSSSRFKENIVRIWTDREGNHNIIRLGGKIFYFNPLLQEAKELDIFKGVEICAVSFDDNNESNVTTDKFLATDYNNRIYECSISLIQNKNGLIIKDQKQNVSTLNFKDWDNEDDEDINDKNDRIYGIKFFRAEKAKKEDKNQDKDKNSNEIKETIKEYYYYIIATTKTKLYQLYGEGKNFKQFFEQYNDSAYNDSCRYFPEVFKRRKDFVPIDLEMLYKDNNKIAQFGWKTETGFCFGTYSYYAIVPAEIKKFTVIPFAKITSDGNKETQLEPISVTHTKNHIFILYKDCLTVISKITSNIIHTQYFQTEYKGVIYNEFSSCKGGNILLFSKTSLFQIPLNDEDKDIWKDHLDIGDFDKAKRSCNNKLLERRIDRIHAEESFEKKDYYNATNIYADSDEKFENICLKFIMKDQLDPLNIYLETYLQKNVFPEKDKNHQPPPLDQKYFIECNLICTLLVEIFLNKNKPDKKSTLEDFRLLIREKGKYLRSGNIIFELLQSYGRMEEFVEYASMMGDYEKAILYYINQHDISSAIEKLTLFAAFADENTLKILSNIFLSNCRLFFRNNPKESISLLQQRFKKIQMKEIIQAIMSSTENDRGSISDELKNSSSSLKISKKEDNSQTILNYLKSLIDKPKVDEENNIHNLYIYYLSKNKSNQEAIIEYLKGPLKSEEDFFHKKKEVLFQIDYAKKLFKNNPPAYSLVLALMGKYLEGVKTALKAKTEECLKIAKFIATNAPGDKLKKSLWIEIFSSDSQSKFKEALNIMRESKILKIEDVLPHITDTIKIEDFKKQISECINDYENNINKLKKDINEYNNTAENIKNDIAKVKKKSMEIQYSSCKCDICQGYIKDKDIYLFPCGHMFDANCIRECLLQYERTGLDCVHEDNVEINQKFLDLDLLKVSAFVEKKEDKQAAEEETQQSGKSGTFINKIFEKTGIKKQENTPANDSNKPKDKNKIKKELNEILSKQCVLCGDYMVESIQNSICKLDTAEFINNKKIKLEDSSGWDYIE